MQKITLKIRHLINRKVTCFIIFCMFFFTNFFCIYTSNVHIHASLVAQMVKNLTILQKTWVWSLSWEEPLEEGMATHSSILAWRSLWTEEPGGLQSLGSQRVGHDWATKHSTANAYIDTYIQRDRMEFCNHIKSLSTLY